MDKMYPDFQMTWNDTTVLSTCLWKPFLKIQSCVWPQAKRRIGKKVKKQTSKPQKQKTKPQPIGCRKIEVIGQAGVSKMGSNERLALIRSSSWWDGNESWWGQSGVTSNRTLVSTLNSSLDIYLEICSCACVVTNNRYVLKFLEMKCT